MESFDYYEALAERIIFDGINSQQLTQVATYRAGKSFQDLEEAVRQGGLAGVRGAEALFDCTASGISKVVEIDTSQSLPEYQKRLREL